MNFTAIDFETANEKRSSVCSVGIANVENGVITEISHHYIRPTPFYFLGINIGIHGITEDDVHDAPPFSEFWPTFKKRIKGPILAHNASFDMSVLRKSLDVANIDYPETDYFCSCVISKLVWPNHSNHKLNTLSASFGIKFTHHNAAEDAKACALITLLACEKLAVNSIYDIKQKCGLRIGSLYANGYKPCGAPKKRKS
ncbi:MAG: 3'-5' exonuclease [Verrucomicrobiota bacterium]|nr:3'-5' exonuclease [Verrucomicrobiota bacterium]